MYYEVNGVGTQQDQCWTSGPSMDTRAQLSVEIANP